MCKTWLWYILFYSGSGKEENRVGSGGSKRTSSAGSTGRSGKLWPHYEKKEGDKVCFVLNLFVHK